MSTGERIDFLAAIAADTIIQVVLDRRIRARADLSAAETPAGVMVISNVERTMDAVSSSDKPKKNRCSNMY